MTLTAEQIEQQMSNAAAGAFREGWDAVKVYAPAEFKKMAVQLASIADNVALYQLDPEQGYSAETGKILFRMQRTACESVLTAVSQLTLIAVQNALNGLMTVLSQVFGAALSMIL
ncbi:hypothetical protein [Undibacterium griseum]|uniref:Uncharacterized protein n=1 Tax=Undibacterium griseum TaxID=2762295 RepID=A0ABR6YN72_9BURK|nr:hypothetical protein [Undibacterium griseum]MBC3885253.1 hypothetical protein [Undibacterium griseum]